MVVQQQIPPSIIWGLLDDRPGTNHQILGILQRLHQPYIAKKIKYTSHASLPFFLWGEGIKGYDTLQSDNIYPPYPDLIIAAGRRGAIIANHIKKQHPSCKWVQIMWPGLLFYRADLTILPSHDKTHSFLQWLFSKVLAQKFHVASVLGTPHPFTVGSTPLHSTSVQKIGICIGGGFEEKVFCDFVSTLNTVIKNTESKIFITTSRRSPAFVHVFLKEYFALPFTFYDWHQKEGTLNPYRMILEKSDCLIITGDSMSMCSEACASGKSVYIYAQPEFCSKKHQRFHKALVDGNHARMLQKKEILSPWSTTPLDATGDVIHVMKEQNLL